MASAAVSAASAAACFGNSRGGRDVACQIEILGFSQVQRILHKVVRGLRLGFHRLQLVLQSVRHIQRDDQTDERSNHEPEE